MAPPGAIEDGNDCDDGDPDVHPGAPERCDGHDDDCNGEVDDDAIDAATWYVDADHDGFGDSASPVLTCQPQAGLAASGGDCDDQDPDRSPAVPEDECSAVDLNCDGIAGGLDIDGDGWPLCEECDDSLVEVYPGATESCNNLDDDCDGTIDEADAADATIWWSDTDGDGHGSSTGREVACEAPIGKVDNSEDCDDTRDSSHPGAEEIPCDGLDNDCVDGDVRCRPEGDHDLADSESTLWGAAENDYAGYGVRVGGDLDGDGRPEWGVGVPGYDGDRGGFFIQTGSPVSGVDLDASRLSIEGDDEEHLVGWDVSNFLEDVGGDGYGEIFISAVDADDELYLFNGPITSSRTLSGRDITIWGTDDSWSIGHAADSEDINGDGMFDFVYSTIGNAYVSGYGWMENAGRVWGFYGPLTADQWTDDSDFRLVNSGTDMLFGDSLCASDLTGDGVADIAVGAPCQAGNCSTEDLHGAAYVFEGPLSGDLWAQDHGQPGDPMSGWRGGNSDTYELGTSLGCKGDLDGDGRVDLLIGGPSGFRGDGLGAIYLVDGSLGGDRGVEEATWALQGGDQVLLVGFQLSSEGDMDGDGFGDLVASWEDSTSAGSVGLYYGGALSGTAAPTDADATWTGHSSSDWAVFVSGGGDLDSDGFDDVLIGAPGEDTNGDNAGAAYIVFGGGWVP